MTEYGMIQWKRMGNDGTEKMKSEKRKKKQLIKLLVSFIQ